MKIDVVKVGYLECNCYLLDINGSLLIVDPGDEFSKIDNVIGSRDVIGVIITHNHFDHIGALDELISKYKVTVYNRSNMNEGINKIGNFVFEVIYTPGHTDDLISIYFREDKCMFCGDFIFKNSIGRYDFEASSFVDMVNSIDKIKKYDDDILIYPGHGDSTLLGYEKVNNLYFK